MYTNQKMQKWSILPAEIFNIIIFYVNENEYSQERMNDLSQCALTCRSWREIAQPLLFSDITLKNFEEASENLLRLMMNNNILGTYVKKLYYWSEVKPASLIIMDFIFPNLEKIELGWDDVNYSFFCKLITKERRFRNLKSIPHPKNHKHDDMYIECLFTLKFQITKVVLEDNDEERNTYLKLCDELFQFPNLQSVHIYQSSNASSRNIMDYVESITVHDNLIYLKKLVLKLAGHSCLRLPFTEPHNIQPSTRIKCIYIHVGCFQNYDVPNEQCMLYIMKKFPNPIQFRLFMNDYNSHFYLKNERNQEYITIFLHFLQYLSKIQDCCVSNSISTDENTAILIKDLLSSINLQTKIKLPRVHITGNDFGTRDTSLTKIRIGLRNNIVDGTRTIDILFNKNHETGFKRQLLNLFQEAGCFFTEATLKIDTIDELVSSLNHIGKYCHKLETLEIEGYDLLEDSLTASEEVLDEAKNYNVKKLCISGSGPTPNQLCFIFAHFPCLKNLTISNFFGPLYSDYISTFLGSSSLKHLTINPKKNFGFSDLSGVHVNITTDSGQNDRISLYTEKDVHTGKWLCYFFVTSVGCDDKIFDSDKDWTVWNIHCRSIEKLNVIFHETVIRNGKKVRLPKTLTLSF